MNPFHVYLYGPGQGPIDSSFEEAQDRLDRLPGLYFEPDGSFAWMRQPGREEVYGIVYDAGDQIRYCDLQGRCSRSTWLELCRAIAGEGAGEELEVLRLPERELQDLQTFASSCLTAGESGES